MSTTMSQMIEQMERKAVKEMIAKGQMPHVKTAEWEAIRAKYELPEAKKVDEVLSEVTLPKGWVVEIDERSQCGRFCEIKTEKGVVVGGTFLKKTPYDYYGSVSWKKNVLKEMGLLL